MEKEIEPIRMGILMKAAAKITEQMTTGIWHLTYEEMETVLLLIYCGMKVIKNREGEDKDVS